MRRVRLRIGDEEKSIKMSVVSSNIVTTLHLRPGYVGWKTCSSFLEKGRRGATITMPERPPIHQIWPKPSCKAQWKGEEDKTDRGRGGKTTSGRTGPGFAKSQRAVENKEKWRKLVVKSSVVPQRPSRLRNRWDELMKWARKRETTLYNTDELIQPRQKHGTASPMHRDTAREKGMNTVFCMLVKLRTVNQTSYTCIVEPQHTCDVY